MSFSFSRICILRFTAGLMLWFLPAVLTAYGQSTDVRFPTAVRGSEIVGAVPARDIGDARLTDHFYTFNGLPGDILITVESKNLNGDFDVFTAAELRPLLKVVVYAETATAVTKNIYLRKPESLILRVEARTPNDDEGSYRIRFTGSFAPLDNRSLEADAATAKEETSSPSRTGDRKTSRVSSSGARIDEPVAEVAAVATPEPTPVTPKEESSTAVTKTPAPRSARGRRPVTRLPSKKPAAKPPDQASSGTSESDEAQPAKPAKKSKTEEGATTAKAGPVNRRPTPRRATPGSTRGSGRTPKPEPTAENGRLIIEVKGGSRIEYLMSTVTRLTVENGEVVIVTEDGYTKRVPLTSVLRMSIAP
ncbi:MAG: hypothetical protein JWM21_1469 [Acidobacteria bacterium]|nr:hypothetical protein [Acidobacteriota bacterium]